MTILRFRYLLGIITIMFFLFSEILSGQERQVYKGPLQIGKYQGEANYQYKIIDNEKVLDGSFLLQRSNLDALLNKEDASFSIQGNLKNSIPVGHWKFQFNELQSDSKTTLDNYQYVVNVSGKQSEAVGILKQGKPHGEWSYKTKNIKNSKVENTEFQSIIDFNNGIPQREFTIENEEQKLVGRFLRNGLAHDEWTLFTDQEIDAAESWNFREGVLKNIVVSQYGNTRQITIQTQASKTSDLKVIPLDSTYLQILKLKLQKTDSKRVTRSGMLDLLEENDKNYQNINAILQNLGNANFSVKFSVKVPYYPLSKKDSTLFVTIADYYKKSRTISNLLLDNTEIAILKLTDQKVRSWEETVTKLTREVLDPLKEAVYYQKIKILQYIPREELFSKIWPNGIPLTPNGINDTNFSLSAMSLLSETTFNRLEGIHKKLSKKITTQKRKQEAIDLEKRMIARRDYLETLSIALNQDTIPVIYRKTIQNIIKSTEDKLATYSEMEDVEKKLSYARELVYCFEKLDLVGKTIAQLPNQQYAVRSSYIDAVWNPFTATLMDETIKKRLLSAYEDVLIPFYLNKIEKGLACEETEQWIDLVNTTYNRMLSMRDEDTYKLERKLKKEQNPQMILEQLAIKSQNQNK